VFLFYFIVVRRATCFNRSTIFRSLLRQVSSSPCPTKVFVTCSIVVEDACVGVTIAYVLVALFCLAVALFTRTAAAIGCFILVLVERDITCFD
jgi:hypothetical protein